jgi:hypothetical protein
MSKKYPRTPHLPYSPGGTSDDRRILSVRPFLGTDLILTEKMDGSNVCLEREACFARSHASTPSHPSFDAFKAFHAVVRDRLGEDLQVFGEWLYAKHSIIYNALPTYFMAFGVRDTKKGLWASWEEVELWADELGVASVPVLGRANISDEKKLRSLIENHARMPSLVGSQREGVVVRVAHGFPDSEFEKSVAKWVRANHVQTDEHWKNQVIVRNRLG